MTFRLYMFLMLLATALSIGAWAIVLGTMDPDSAGVPGFILFYVTLLSSCVGILTCLGVAIRVLLLKRQDVLHRQVRVAFRHGVMAACVAVASLFLSSRNWFHWWVWVLVIVLVCGCEYFFLIKEGGKRS